MQCFVFVFFSSLGGLQIAKTTNAFASSSGSPKDKPILTLYNKKRIPEYEEK